MMKPSVLTSRFDAGKKYFIYFILYSIAGWLYEIFLEVVIYRWGFTNRGWLYGPYCIVYGFGALTFLLLFRKRIVPFLSPIRSLIRLVFVFLGCALTATAIELAASYIMEALTGSWAWQTYASYKYHFQARIALSTSIRFGLGGLLFLYVLQPLFEKILQSLTTKMLDCCFYGLAFLLLLDLAATLLAS